MLRPLNEAVSKSYVRDLIHEHPACLPIAEIDAGVFRAGADLCRGLNTPTGAIDNFLVTPKGLPVLVECGEFWRNPEARREVVGQILDYAKELSRWSSSDLQRAVSRSLKRQRQFAAGNSKADDPQIDEVQFNDALTANLRRGRFLLLIVGDGIREGVEVITRNICKHMRACSACPWASSGELPIYAMPNGDRLVVPRVLARTTVITRSVVAVPDGYTLQEPKKPRRLPREEWP